ncbi:MAG: hypothetical protein AAGC93_30840 [Cyanobacteria bacterium P01_F01_bin.53]
MTDILPMIPDCRDPFDALFLHFALVGRADYLTTDDRDLLAVAAPFSCPIVTAAQFIKIVNSA